MLQHLFSRQVADMHLGTAAFCESSRAGASHEVLPVATCSRLAVCACLVGSVAAMCPDDPEVDLCEVDEQETSHGVRNGAWMALLLPLASTRPSLAGCLVGGLGCCDLRRAVDLLQERAVLWAAHSRGLCSSARNRCLPVLLRQACLLHCRTSDAS